MFTIDFGFHSFGRKIFNPVITHACRIASATHPQRIAAARSFICSDHVQIMFVQSRSIASTAHTDVKRPEMWSKLDRGKSTEAISVVLISLDDLLPTHFAVKKNLTYAQVFRSKAVTIFLMFY